MRTVQLSDLRRHVVYLLHPKNHILSRQVRTNNFEGEQSKHYEDKGSKGRKIVVARTVELFITVYLGHHLHGWEVHHHDNTEMTNVVGSS